MKIIDEEWKTLEDLKEKKAYFDNFCHSFEIESDIKEKNWLLEKYFSISTTETDFFDTIPYFLFPIDVDVYISFVKEKSPKEKILLLLSDSYKESIKEFSKAETQQKLFNCIIELLKKGIDFYEFHFKNYFPNFDEEVLKRCIKEQILNETKWNNKTLIRYYICLVSYVFFMGDIALWEELTFFLYNQRETINDKLFGNKEKYYDSWWKYDLTLTINFEGAIWGEPYKVDEEKLEKVLAYKLKVSNSVIKEILEFREESLKQSIEEGKKQWEKDEEWFGE